jgi:hypothetical protein
VRKSNLTDNESAKLATDKGVIQGYCALAVAVVTWLGGNFTWSWVGLAAEWLALAAALIVGRCIGNRSRNRSERIATDAKEFVQADAASRVGLTHPWVRFERDQRSRTGRNGRWPTEKNSESHSRERRAAPK